MPPLGCGSCGVWALAYTSAVGIMKRANLRESYGNLMGILGNQLVTSAVGVMKRGVELPAAASSSVPAAFCGVKTL